MLYFGLALLNLRLVLIGPFFQHLDVLAQELTTPLVVGLLFYSKSHLGLEFANFISVEFLSLSWI